MILSQPQQLLATTATKCCTTPTALSPSRWTSKLKIGQGSFGVVFAFSGEGYGDIAVKVVKLTDENKDAVAREVKYLQLVQGHENVIRFLDGSVKTRKKQLIITELALCNFHLIITKGGSMKIGMAKRYSRQLLDGIDHIHSQGIAHCDLKLENLLLGRDGYLKIADFGLALPYVDFQSNQDGYLEYFGFIGTRATASPELVEGISKFAPVKNDIWACGVIILEFLTGVAGRWQQASSDDAAYRCFFEDFESSLAKDEDNFVRFMLQTNPRKRPLVFRILRHPWLQVKDDSPSCRKRSNSLCCDEESSEEIDSMTDLFRSAFNYLSQAAPNRPPGAPGSDHALVGTSIEVGGFRLKIRSLLAEGGFALVFSAQDAQGNWFALKRQLAADREATEAVLKEIRILRELTGHAAILRYVQAAQLSPPQSGAGRTEFLLLTELCSGGSVVDFLNKQVLSPEQIIKIFYSACSAVRHMHERPVPITHRDIKIENLLFDSSGFVKLCDFGSATTEVYCVDDSWTALRRSQVEDDMQRHTTPMYRAPEILDLYQNFPIGPAQDIWALGCILCYLCYRVHPFEDSAKLRIINAKYTLPDDAVSAFSMFHPLIQRTLQPDPRNRPAIGELCEAIGALAVAMGVDLKTKVPGIDTAALTGSAPEAMASSASPRPSRQVPQRPPPPVRNESLSDHQQPSSNTQAQASAVFGALKGQGISLFKNIKDRSAAVVQTVQSTYGGKGPDVQFITSRLVIAPMAEGMPEALAGPAEDVMRQHLMEQQPLAPPVKDGAFQDGEFHERFAEMRIPAAEDDDSDHFDFDCEKNAKAESHKSQVADLLDFGVPAPVTVSNQPKTIPFDPFGHFEPTPTATAAVDDLLGFGTHNGMARNVSAPTFEAPKTTFDPFAEFMASNSNSTANSVTGSSTRLNDFSASARNSGRATPTTRPNYGRSNFDGISGSTGVKPKVTANAFDDLLTSQGFSSSSKNSSRSLADMKRSEDIRQMDPTSIAIRDWTNGKEKNIRALLCSLNNILWEGADRWNQPSMGDILEANKLKKQYHKALLVVHPDKQNGTENYELAKAIAGTLKTAWDEFVNAGSPSM